MTSTVPLRGYGGD